MRDTRYNMLHLLRITYRKRFSNNTGTDRDDGEPGVNTLMFGESVPSGGNVRSPLFS